MSFSGFPKEGLAFLSEIIINNSKAWLDANRDTYEATIVRPNKAYVEENGGVPPNTRTQHQSHPQHQPITLSYLP